MPFLANTHFCKNYCGEIFKTWYCDKCKKYISDLCKYCHEEHFNEVDRMNDLARLKRNLK